MVSGLRCSNTLVPRLLTTLFFQSRYPASQKQTSAWSSASAGSYLSVVPNGERIAAEVGRNLTLTSEQYSNRYDSKQQSASAGGSFTFGSMTPSGSLNLSKDKMHSTYDSVQEQTGLFAGKGGFDVRVGEHTQLNGAVMLDRQCRA